MSNQVWRKAAEVYLAASRTILMIDWIDFVPASLEITIPFETFGMITDFHAKTVLQQSPNNLHGIIGHLQCARSAFDQQGIDEIRVRETEHGLEIEVVLHGAEQFVERISYRGDYSIVWVDETPI